MYRRYFILFLMIITVGFQVTATHGATPVDGYTYVGKIRIDHLRTSFPGRIALDSRGTLYVVDGYNDHVMKYDRAGNYIGDIKVEDAAAVGVAPDGRVYIGANGESPWVGIYEGDRLVGYLGAGPGEFKSVRDIAVDEQTSEVYVVDSIRNVVSVYTATGQHLRDIVGLSYPQAVDVEGSEVYIVDAPVVVDPTSGSNTTSARVSVYDSSGQLLRSFEDFLAFGGHMVRPQDITVTSEGYILIPEAIAQAVLVYDSLGNYIGEIKSTSESLYIPRSTAFGADRRLYVSSNMTKSVLIFGLNGYTYLQVEPKSLSFVCQSGVCTGSQIIRVSNLGTGTLGFGVTVTEGWIQLSSSSGVLEAGGSVDIQVGVDASSLQAGSYVGKVVVSADSGAVEEVGIEMQVLESPQIVVNPSELYFTALAGGSNPQSQVLVIQAEGDLLGQVQWRAAVEGGWLSITPMSGKGDTVTQALVSVDITGLVAGVYNGRVVIEASGVSNSPVEVSVVLEVQSSGRIRVVTNLLEARFRIEGPVVYEGSGREWTAEGVPDGRYRIEYYDVAGYIKPSSEEKVLSGGGEIEFVGEYRRVKERILVSYEVGRGAETVIKILDEAGTELNEIDAFVGRKGGVGTAVGDIDGDGAGEVVAGLLRGGSEVALYEGSGEEMGRFKAFVDGMGVEVAAGDLDGDGVDEIVVANRGTAGVRVFSYRMGEVVDRGVYFSAVKVKREEDDRGELRELRRWWEARKRILMRVCDVDGDMFDEVVTVVREGKKGEVKVWSVKADEGGWTVEVRGEFKAPRGWLIRGIDCADGDGDGAEEIYLVTGNKIVIYSGEGDVFGVIKGVKDKKRYGRYKEEFERWRGEDWDMEEALERSKGLNSIGIGDIDGDGAKEAVVGKQRGMVEIWDMKGHVEKTFRIFNRFTEVRVSVGDLGL
jgi:hypothetical protein